MPANNDPLTRPEKIKHAVLNLARHIPAVLRRTLWNGAGEWHLKKSEKQEVKQWTKFGVYVSQKSPGLSLSDFYQQELFDEHLEKATDIKHWEILYRVCTWICLLVGAYLIAQLCLGHIGFKTWIIAPFAAAVYFMTLTELSFKTRIELNSETLVEAMTVPNKAEAQKFLNSLLTKNLPKYRFAIRDKMGRYQELPLNFYKAENVLLFLFGKENHRRALPLTGELPIGDLYISVAAETKNTRPKDDCIEFLLNKNEIKIFYDYVKSSDGFDPGEDMKNLSKARDSWLKMLKVMLDDFELWLKVHGGSASLEDRKTFNARIDFALTFNPFIKDNYQRRKKFLTGKHRNFNNWRKKVQKSQKEQ